MYDREVESVTYPIGTTNIDVVDAKRKQMIWEGVAEGRISETEMAKPQEVIRRVVNQLFEKFPGRASAVTTRVRRAIPTETSLASSIL
jgi:Domain of unknown function (DUF4136)